MNQFIRERLEDYLTGTLTTREQEELESYLHQHPGSAAELKAYLESSKWFEDIRAPENTTLERDFYAQVMQRVDQQKAVPFWAFFLQPGFASRLAFVGLTWMALLGSYFVGYNSNTEGSVPIAAERILSRPRPPGFNIRLGSDIDQNRNSMLAVLIVRTN